MSDKSLSAVLPSQLLYFPCLQTSLGKTARVQSTTKLKHLSAWALLACHHSSMLNAAFRGEVEDG